jgi:hypothetical protein
MNSRTAYLAGALLLVTACASLVMSADKPKEGTDLASEITKLETERVKTATKAWESTQAAYEADTIGITQLLAAAQGLFDAELAVCSTSKEKIAAHQKNVDRLLNTEKKIAALHNAGVKGGESERYHAAKLARETAKIELLKARLKLEQCK